MTKKSGTKDWKDGDRVLLPANPTEDWPEEHGVLEGIDGDCFLIRLDKKYRTDRYDDGLREVDRTEVKREQA
jgi:hypothetical protein